jgi:hypothetical protein
LYLVAIELQRAANMALLGPPWPMILPPGFSISVGYISFSKEYSPNRA